MTSIDEAFGEGTEQRYRTVLNKFGESATVWLVTFHDGMDWEQTIYVIGPNKAHAISVSRALTTFDKPRFVSAYEHKLHELEPAETAEFINRAGQPQNIAVFDAEPRE